MPKRVDANQAEIVAALRAVGCSVCDTHELGKGFPDLTVGRMTPNGPRTYLLEVKGPKINLNAREAIWHSLWRGQVAIVHSIDEALRSVGTKWEG